MRWLAVAGLLVGCYRPDADRACVTRCDPAEVGQANACPGSLVCAADGMCRAPDGSCSVEPVADGAVDTVPSDTGAFCYGQGIVQFCLPTEPTGVRALVTTIDTDTDCDGSVFQTNGPEACLVMGGTLSLMNVRVTGTRPLVVLASDTITLAGTIDVASRRIDAGAAAGSNDATCEGTANFVVSAGGNGGSFGGLGGKGGLGGTNPAMPVDPTVLRGGCPGQIGNGNPLALGGRGGGAIYFIAGGLISIGSATINASGAGGTAGPASGGGGGGSGGMIGFDAPSIMALASAQAFANGGGGAGGATDSSLASAGAEPMGYTSAGAGGLGAGGANGGNGSLATPNGTSGVQGSIMGGGGGGGGGGAGVIVIYPVSQASVFGGRTSPPVTQ